MQYVTNSVKPPFFLWYVGCSSEALVVVTKDIGLEVNADKTKYVHDYISRSECRTKAQYKEW